MRRFEIAPYSIITEQLGFFVFGFGDPV